MTEVIRIRWPALALSLGMLALSGCGHLRLYSPGLDEQGQKAQRAWKDVDLPGMLQAERERTSALLKAEATYRETSTLTSRDLKLLTIATSPSVEKSLKEPVNRALLDLIGDGAFYAALSAAREKEASSANQYENGAQDFRVRGLEMPSCADILSGEAAKSLKDVPNPGRLMGAVQTGVTACTPSTTTDPNAVRNLLKCIKLSGAALGVCTASLPRLQAEIETLYALEAAKDTKPNASGRNEYRIAAANYKTLSNSMEGGKLAAAPAADAASGSAAAASAPADAASAPKGPAQAKLAESYAKLKDAVAKLKTFEDKTSLKLISDERLAAIDESLGSLMSPKAAGAEGETEKDREGRALQRLAETADGWKDVKASAAKVLARPLLAQQEVERLQVQALDRAIGVDTVEIEWRRRTAALTQELADNYLAASNALRDIQASDGGLVTVMYGNQGDKAATPPASLAVRTKVMGAVANYGYAVGYLQGQYEAAALQLKAVDGMRQLDLAENALRQWEVLIGVNVDILAAWASAGVKDETISRGINALLLLWIGYGVN